MSIEILEFFSESLEDLEEYEDKYHHSYCSDCYPNHKRGVPFTSICGRIAVHDSLKYPDDTLPPNACPLCLRTLRCTKCGGNFI